MPSGNQSPLRVGIIGAGNISGIHLKALASLGDIDVHVAGICDLERSKAQKQAETFGVPAVFADAENLIASDEVDIVLVATPPPEHARLTLLALRAGKHVICEKPMAMSVTECDAMIATADTSAGKLFVVQNRLYTDAMRKAAEMITDGMLGQIMKVKTEGYEGEETLERMEHVKTDPDGVIRTQMMHQTYVVPGLIGQEITNLAVMSNDLGCVPMVASDVNASAMFAYSGRTLQTSVGLFGLSKKRNEHNMEIFGTAGELRSTRIGDRGDRHEILQYRPSGHDWTEVKLDNTAVLGPEFAAMWRDYVHSIRTSEAPKTTVEEARYSMVVVDAMYESAKNKGKLISLLSEPTGPTEQPEPTETIEPPLNQTGFEMPGTSPALPSLGSAGVPPSSILSGSGRSAARRFARHKRRTAS